MMTDVEVAFASWGKHQAPLTELRTRVFVHEQQVPVELEMDDLDALCRHVMATIDHWHIIGTARLLPSNYIGRMCVAREYRGRGIGGKILSFLIEHAMHTEIDKLMLNAQISALSFYQRYGFEIDSEIFVEAGIKHRHMTLIIEN